MKYSVEIKNGIAKETLVFNGKEYARTTKKTSFSFGSISDDMDFSEQMEEDGVSDNVLLEQIYDTIDGFFVGELLDMAESEDKA